MHVLMNLQRGSLKPLGEPIWNIYPQGTRLEVRLGLDFWDAHYDRFPAKIFHALYLAQTIEVCCCADEDL
jgi:hypothetical protein